MEDIRNSYRELVQEPEGEPPLGRPKNIWEDNIKIDLRGVGWGDLEWIHLAQHRVQWWALVYTVVNLQVP
jgi:hypothetical protein